MPDPYRLHRTTLAPLLPGAPAEALHQAAAQVKHIGETTFLYFLHRQGLAPAWHNVLAPEKNRAGLGENFLQQLQQQHREAVAHYLLQKAGLAMLQEALNGATIPHVVYKGAATRERLYKEPALRPAGDIDLLVAPGDRNKSIQALLERGFILDIKDRNASHEVTLQRDALFVDLHWDILRPGRTREPMVEALLASREKREDHWSLSDAGATFVALVHPVFAKHGTTPIATLNSVLDLAHWLQHWPHARAEVEGLLEKAGLRTAAWLSLRRLALLAGPDSGPTAARAQAIAAQWAPAQPKRAYLERWLRWDLASKLRNYPWLTKAGFTLLAHDTLGDAAAAARAARQASSTRDKDSGGLQALAERSECAQTPGRRPQGQTERALGGKT